MPELADFSRKVLKRGCPIKALLLDQSFSAGVGNWVAGEGFNHVSWLIGLCDNVLDEVLYHARIHPEQRCNLLSQEQIQSLHVQVRDICTLAVEVNADYRKFPTNWLFKHRWVNATFHPFAILEQGIDVIVKG